jgi:hypothetical protein
MRGYCPLFLKKIIIASGPLVGPPVIFSDYIVHTIDIIIHFQNNLKNFLDHQNTPFTYIFFCILYVVFSLFKELR